MRELTNQEKKERYSRVNIQMSKNTKNKLQDFCNMSNIPMSKLVNMLIYKYFFELNISNFNNDELKKL